MACPHPLFSPLRCLSQGGWVFFFSIRSMWPSHLHLRLLTSLVMCSMPVRSVISSFVTRSPQCILRVLPRHFPSNSLNLLSNLHLVLHISAAYNETEHILEYKKKVFVHYFKVHPLKYKNESFWLLTCPQGVICDQDGCEFKTPGGDFNTGLKC